MSRSIPLFEIAWDDRDIDNVVDSVSRGGYWAKGPYVDEFERRLEAYLGVEHARVVNSGTTALVTALKALGIGPGDEVIVPSFTFIATANAVRLVGATPVFADIERDTYGLDAESVETAITADTAAIMPVHAYGHPFDADALVSLVRDHDVALVEDAAAALGATYRDEMAGTVGDVAAFSFCQNKIVATGEGGAVVTDDDELARNVELYRSHGRSSGEYFESADSGEYVSPGTNYRMPDVVAALGCAQMEKAEELIAGRRRAARYLTDGIADVPGVEPPTDAVGRHVYQLYTVTLDASIDRERVVDELDARGVASKIYWEPIHRTAQYAATRRAESGLRTTERVASRVLSLPIHPGLGRDEAARVVSALSAAVDASRQYPHR